jgi:hypothetical protein
VHFSAPNQTAQYFASPAHSNIAARPKLVIEYLIKPTIGFHDGSTAGGYYSDSLGEIFKYLSFDPMIAGQITIAKKVFCKNLSGFDVENLRVFIRQEELPDGMYVRLSETNNPFIENEQIIYNGFIVDNDEKEFYVRIRTDDNTQQGGDFNIYAQAAPVF